MDYPRKSEGALDWNLDEKIEQTISPEKWLTISKKLKSNGVFWLSLNHQTICSRRMFRKKNFSPEKLAERKRKKLSERWKEFQFFSFIVKAVHRLTIFLKNFHEIVSKPQFFEQHCKKKKFYSVTWNNA